MPHERDWLGELQAAREAQSRFSNAEAFGLSEAYRLAAYRHGEIKNAAIRAGFRWANCAQCGRPVREGAVTCDGCGEGGDV